MMKRESVNTLTASATYTKFCDMKGTIMVEKKKNPIAEQSKQWLITSLLTLMDEKDYTKITDVYKRQGKGTATVFPSRITSRGTVWECGTFRTSVGRWPGR